MDGNLSTMTRQSVRNMGVEDKASSVSKRAKRLCEPYDIAVGETAASPCSLVGEVEVHVLVSSKRACKLLCSDKRKIF